MADKLQFVTPKGELRWVFITGKGKRDYNDKKDVFSAATYYKSDDPLYLAFKAKVEKYWEENCPRGVDIKSNGLYDEKDKDTKELTGWSYISCWTNTTFKDKDGKVSKTKIIKTYNAGNRKAGQKPREIFLGDKGIGNGSIGTISGTMDIYIASKSEAGVSLYLDAVQLIKFIEYSKDPGFVTDENEEEEGFQDVEQTDNESGFSTDGKEKESITEEPINKEPVNKEPVNKKAKPRL